MNRVRLWPHAIIIIAAVIIVAAVAVLAWRKYEPKASASGLPNPARIERVDGQAGINHSLDNSANGQWIAASANAPVSVGDRLYTRDNSHLQVAFTGRNFAVLAPDTSLDVLDLSNGRTQVALREGSSLFDVGALASGQLFEVATPCGAVDLQDRGTYRITVENGGNATATAFSGRAQVVGQSGSGAINKGEVLTVPCGASSGQTGTGTISRVNYDEAGSYLDSYYRYRYPKTYDGRYRNYYTYLDDPYYYDPASRYSSYNYVSDYVPGVDDLDDYGDWQYVSNYGYCWHPRVDAAWAPYESGEWTMDYPYGLTWVSTEPWGYAPYHYGRWSYVSNEWFWVPDTVYATPTYSPALTAFIPLGSSSFAWIALGPGDPYVPYYYDQSWQPVYQSSYPTVTTLVNFGAPNAITVVPAQDFVRVIDPTIVTHVDPQTLVQVQPVLDPLRIDPLRQAAFATRQAERRVDVPQVVAQQIINTPVVTTTAPVAPRFSGDLARNLRVQTIPASVRRQGLKLNDQRAATATQNQPAQSVAGQNAPNLAAEQAREKQMADLARQAARGDRNARQQMQQLRQQQIAERQAARTMNQPAQAERVGQPLRPQTELPRVDQRALRQQQQAQRAAARQQMITSQQAQRAAQQQQMQSQRQRMQVPRAQARATATRNAPQPRAMSVPRAQPVAPRAIPQPAQPRVAPRAMPQSRPPVQTPQARAQAQPRPQPVQPRAQPQPRPQAQPRSQPVRPPQAQGKPPAQAKPPEQKGNAKKKPGGP